jgi:xylulokinase
VLETLEQSAASKPLLLHHAGGGAASDVWCQMRADVLQRPIRRAAYRDAGTLGAAILAGAGVGVFSSIAQAVKTCVQFDRLFEPDPAKRNRLDARFDQFKALYVGLKPWNADWNR